MNITLLYRHTLTNIFSLERTRSKENKRQDDQIEIEGGEKKNLTSKNAVTKKRYFNDKSSK